MNVYVIYSVYYTQFVLHTMALVRRSDHNMGHISNNILIWLWKPNIFVQKNVLNGSWCISDTLCVCVCELATKKKSIWLGDYFLWSSWRCAIVFYELLKCLYIIFWYVGLLSRLPFISISPTTIIVYVIVYVKCVLVY